MHIAFSGAFFDKADANGQSLSDYMSFGTVTATCLVIIVNAQVFVNDIYTIRREAIIVFDINLVNNL